MNKYDELHNEIYKELKDDDMTISELNKLNQAIHGLLIDKLNEIKHDELIFIDSNIQQI
jgi:hypothetical protein